MQAVHAAELKPMVHFDVNIVLILVHTSCTCTVYPSDWLAYRSIDLYQLRINATTVQCT